MKPIPTITVDFGPGCTIAEYIDSMLELAARLKCTVRCKLNGVRILAPSTQQPGETWGGALLDRYYRDLERNTGHYETGDQSSDTPTTETLEDIANARRNLYNFGTPPE